jgi:archaellum component FlaC
MLKRNRNQSFNDCCTYMKRLKLTNSLESTAEIIIEEQNQEFINKIDNIEQNINKLSDKINKLEYTADKKFTSIEDKINTLSNKVDKLVNLISNISDIQLYNKSIYIK